MVVVEVSMGFDIGIEGKVKWVYTKSVSNVEIGKTFLEHSVTNLEEKFGKLSSQNFQKSHENWLKLNRGVHIWHSNISRVSLQFDFLFVPAQKPHQPNKRLIATAPETRQHWIKMTAPAPKPCIPLQNQVKISVSTILI